MTTEDEFDPEDILFEINRKLANVSITHLTFDSEHDTVDKSNVCTIYNLYFFLIIIIIIIIMENMYISVFLFPSPTPTPTPI